ncbi:MAG: lipopolysaccharide assembly protein LapA domain-containing protein [Actinomycetota bacterium]
MSDEILDDGQPTTKSGGGQARLIVVALVAVGLVAFVVQNTDSTPVTWLMFEGSAPLWVVIVAAAVAGAVLSELGGYLMRRRKRRKNTD